MQWICSLVLVDCFSPMARFGLQNFSVSWIRARDVVTNVARTETRVGRLGVCLVVAVMRPLQTLVGNKPPSRGEQGALRFLGSDLQGSSSPAAAATPTALALHRLPAGRAP
jgi:hypothetical protein